MKASGQSGDPVFPTSPEEELEDLLSWLRNQVLRKKSMELQQKNSYVAAAWRYQNVTAPDGGKTGGRPSIAGRGALKSVLSWPLDPPA